MAQEEQQQNQPARGTSKRGFASMDPQLQKSIASQGGRAAHRSGHAHEFNSQEAAEAGRKGGVAVSRDRRHMAEIGAKGGHARGHNHAHSNVPPTNSMGVSTESASLNH